jgi:broad specificity phosphatase PhoE
MAILLVRHAEPEVVPSTDPRRWALSEAGREEAKKLGTRLPQCGLWLSSTERKAYETLLCAAGGRNVAIAQDPGFDEVHRDEPFDDQYEARRLAWVAGHLDERHAGWETPQETAARFEHAISEHAASGSPLVVASHGMAITAWLLHARRSLGQQGAPRFWKALALPDVIRVE